MVIPILEERIGTGVFEASVDTTFALYRPFTKGGSSMLEHHLRVGKPYSMHHLPWYVDKTNLSDNENFISLILNNKHIGLRN